MTTPKPHTHTLTQFKKIPFLRLLLPTILTLLLIATLPFASYQLLFSGKIYSSIQVAGLPLTGLTPSKAQQALKDRFSAPLLLPLTTPTTTYILDSASFNLQYDWAASTHTAYQIGRTGPFFLRLKNQFTTAKNGVNLPLAYSLDSPALQSQLTQFAQELNIPTLPPQLKIQDQQIIFLPGQSGQHLDTRTLKLSILNSLSSHSDQAIPLPITPLSPELTPQQTLVFASRGKNLLGKQLVITAPHQNTTLTPEQILTFLDPHTRYNQDKIKGWIESWTAHIDRPPQNAKFAFQNGRVTEFQPALPGLTVKQDELLSLLTQSLDQLEASPATSLHLNTPIATTSPLIATQDVNSLGIKELVGHGQSRFKGSISSRVHNIVLAASRLNGLLIPPHQDFSFNTALGEVSLSTGYQRAYIIKSGQTLLDDGGGVCQVSTTLFRVVLNAGLPILGRTAHAYRVPYYEQDTDGKPGLDATVYAPTTDFKFQNDTPTHLLIQTHTDPKTATLTIDLYGTSDGRTVEIGKPQIWDVTPAPPDLYIDDPTLPAGTTKQIDWAAKGTKSKFTWKVTRNDQTLQDKTFYSFYKPWQAKFLRGTGPNQ